MIGTFIRSSHHFERSCDYSQTRKIIAIRHNSVILGEILKTKDKKGRDMYLYFQNINHNVDLAKALSCCSEDCNDIIREMFTKHPRCVLLFRFDELRNYGTQFIMLPTNFDDIYQSFTQQNRKMLEPVFSKYCYKEDDFSKAMFAICESANFFVWGAKNVRNNRISIMTIYRIMVWNKLYGQLVSKLKKGTITAYNTTKTVLELLNECENLRKTKRGNDIVNLFNTDQKKLLRNNFEKLPLDVLSKFAILSKTKQQNFIRKVSTMNDVDEIIRLMSFTTSKHFKWNKESLLDYIEHVEGLKCKVVFTSDTTVLVEVNDYDTIKKLAKTTNWCISKNKTYWNNYMNKQGHTTQYVLFDFSKKEDDELSIVGFTTQENNGMTHAHSFTNADLMKADRYTDNRPYRSLLQNNDTRMGIYKVISNNKIPMSLITRFRSKFTKWDKESFLEIFHKFIPEDNYTVYYDENNKMVISTKAFNGIYAIFGDAYMNVFSDYYRNNEHIFFLDFNKDVSDYDKLRFAVVTNNPSNSSYKTANNMYNEYMFKSDSKFNETLSEMGLPYNIICRPDSIKNRLEEAINNQDIDEIEKHLTNDQVKELLLSNHNNSLKNSLSSELIRSINDYFSLELLNRLEKHGYTLSNLINHSTVRSIIQRYYGDACASNGYRHYPTEASFDEDVNFEKLLTNNFDEGTNQSKKGYIARCYMFNRLLNEYLNNEKILKMILLNLLTNLSNWRYGGYITEKVINLGLNYVDFNKLSPEVSNIISITFSNNIKSVIDKLLKINITNEDVRKYILSYCSTKNQSDFKKAWGIIEEKKEEPKQKTSDEIPYIKLDDSFWSTISVDHPWATYSIASN